MKNIPEMIYLQVGDIKENETGDRFQEIDFNDLSGITWSKHKMFKSDIKYYHEDYLKAKVREIRKSYESQYNIQARYASDYHYQLKEANKKIQELLTEIESLKIKKSWINKLFKKRGKTK